MRRVLVTGLAVATIDGAVLGTAAALGWTLLAVIALVAGAGGAVVVAMSTPPARAAARPSTVTLGLPVRDPEYVEDPAVAASAPSADVDSPRHAPQPAPAAAAA